MEISYKYGSRTISAEVNYKNRKTLDLKVFPEGDIIITAPENTSLKKIIEKVKPKSKWIIQQQKQFELYKPFSKERLFTSGETHRYLGRQYKLLICEEANAKQSIKLSKGIMEVYAVTKRPEVIVTQYYKERATVIFNFLLLDLLEEFPQFQQYTIVLKHRFMKKRWGSCASNGNILLNTELIKASKDCIQYVLIHELCHLKHPNHSKAFYQLLTELMPHWEKSKHKLEVMMA